MKKLKLLSLSLLSMMAWTNVMAQKASVTIGTTGYSTTCLSFPAECPNMVTLPTPKGLWTFDDSSNLMAEAGTGVASMTASAGVTANGDGSITVPVGDKLTMATNLAATTIDTYTLMMDIKLGDVENWTSLYQNKLGNDGDASLFVHKGLVGRWTDVNGIGYHYGISANEYTRIVFVVDNLRGRLYINGRKISQSSSQSTTHWRLSTGLLFFADENGEETEVVTTQIRFYDEALSDAQVAKLGTTADVPASVIYPEPIGRWTFDNSETPLDQVEPAGSAILQPTTHVKGTVTTQSNIVGASITAVSGPSTGNKALNVPVKSSLRLTHNQGSSLGTYTVLMDVKAANVSGYGVLLQNYLDNSQDGALFFKNGQIGIGTYSGSFTANTWHRVIFVVKPNDVKVYLNGSPVYNNTNATEYNKHWNLSTGVLFFADENDDNSEEKEVQVAEICFWNVALTAEQIATFGTVGSMTSGTPAASTLEAYTGTIHGNYLTLNPVEGTIPANCAVVLKGTPNNTYYFYQADAVSAIAGNDLQGSDGTVTGSSGNIFALSDVGGTVGFYPVGSGVTVPEGKAYLNMTGLLVKEFLPFDFGDDDATGLNDFRDFKDSKDVIFNLAGQLTSKLQKGINIINGKKVLF